MNPNSPLAPSPLLKDEPPSGLDCSGDFKAAPDIRQSGPAAGGGYVLRTGPKVKVSGTAHSNGPELDRPKSRAWQAGMAGLEPATRLGCECSNSSRKHLRRPNRLQLKAWLKLPSTNDPSFQRHVLLTNKQRKQPRNLRVYRSHNVHLQ